MTPPPLTREARDWLLEQCGADWAFRKALDMMPLTPSDDLDAVRARWKPLASATITAYDSKYIFGHQDAYPYCPCAWDRESGMALMNTAADLTPASPHAALIAELKTVDMHQPSEMYSLCKRAADALEKQP